MRRLLLVSLILNLALVAAVGYRFRSSSPSVRAPEEPQVVKPVARQTKPAAEKFLPEKTKSDAPAKPAFNWRNVESPDYKIYIANLRGLHCPESTIADIIIADVSKYFRNKLAPFRKDTDTTYKFWLADNGYNRRDPAYEKLRVETEREKNKLLKELLGRSYKEELAKANGWQIESNDSFSQSLSKEKKDQMADITEKFSEMRSEIYQRSRGGQDDEDRQALTKIAQEQTAALAKIFTPEELFEYQLRFSETAQNAKWNDLQGLDTTEEEFRAIMKSKMALENPELVSGQKPSAEERSRLLKETVENLKTTLGEDRYKDYTLNQNWEYRNLKNIVEKNGGNKEIARQVYALKDDLQKAVNQVRNDRSLTREQRDEKLLAIKAETDKTLTDALGARGYKALKRNSQWIQEIARGIQTK
ncbi:MAG: hypothetical protein JWM68_3985 [Verrucomicrobiales bacterium]|nr:hypothetical protein [Verrucomicrobiales bacterium]